MLLNWEKEGKEMVWQGLCIAIQRCEGVRGKGSCCDPLVMCFVEMLVKKGVVKSTMYVVDEAISEGQKQHKLEKEVKFAVLKRVLIEFRISTYFKKKPWKGINSHNRDGAHCHRNLLLDLIF